MRHVHLLLFAHAGLESGVSLNLGTHVFVSIWKYVSTSMSELQLGLGRRECVRVRVCEGVFACAWVCV